MPLANGGRLVEPTVIAKVLDNNTGETIENGGSQSEQVIKPATAYMITDILSDVTRRGTARRANASFKNVAIAGKTGTSRDGWFVGYTPNLVCAVWVRFDDNQQLGLTGAEAALPAWVEFMKEAVAMRPSLGGSSFAKPSGIVSVKIDPETGELAGPNCPASQTFNVAAQFAPRLECFKHLPDLESEEDAVDSEGLSESDPSVTDSAELTQTNEFTDQTLPTPNEGQDDTDESVVNKLPRHDTQTEFSPSGRAVLKNALVVPVDPSTPKPGKNLRP